MFEMVMVAVATEISVVAQILEEKASDLVLVAALVSSMTSWDDVFAVAAVDDYYSLLEELSFVVVRVRVKQLVMLVPLWHRHQSPEVAVLIPLPL